MHGINNPAQVDIEEIMREIRLEILGSQGATQRIPGLSKAFRGKRFQPDMYDHLYQAGLFADVGEIPLFLTPSRFPVVGFLWQSVRRMWHKIALLYVTGLAGKQSLINQQLLTAVVALVNEFESQTEDANRSLNV